MKKIITLISVIFIIFINSCINIYATNNEINNIKSNNLYYNIFDDFDPLIDINITVKINCIRALYDIQTNNSYLIKVIINDIEFKSPIYKNNPYIYNINWSATLNVPDNIEYVNIQIQLYESDKLCDISADPTKKVSNIFYNIKKGYWTGDDYRGDQSGYGRLNGYDDKYIENNEKDCELYFIIFQNDYDNDNIPYYVEINNYKTNPEFDDSQFDYDNDLIPNKWEHFWGYNITSYNNHNFIDIDNDGLTNFEEYLTSQWNSDPFRKDIFYEIDQMDLGPNEKIGFVKNESFELLKNRFNKRNMVYHIDTGIMGGGEIIPFDEETNYRELKEIYKNYFLHNIDNYWRRDVFHYGIIIYNYPNVAGHSFVGECPLLYWNYKGINSFQISRTSIQSTINKTNKSSDFIYACYIMHESGHSFGIDFLKPLGCDIARSMKPWQIGYWIFKNYKSCMNYRYVYEILDYSDGSHGFLDYNDWDNLNFTWFQLS